MNLNSILFQIFLTVLTYSIMGLTFGIGVTVVRKYPKLGEFLTQRPILGWTLAFTLGSLVSTTIIAAASFALVLWMYK